MPLHPRHSGCLTVESKWWLCSSRDLLGKGASVGTVDLHGVTDGLAYSANQRLHATAQSAPAAAFDIRHRFST